jgi:glutathione synthase/RimK-type ligase-like ATP-grasp enzyme
MPSTVLIITNDHDEHASAVIRELQTRDVPVFRFHPEDLPHACSISLEIRDGHIDGEIRNAYHRIALNDVCAAWFRRARNLFADFRGLTPALTSEKLEDYVTAQCRATVSAFCEALDTPLWVGHPQKLRRAEVKALQYAYAHQAGLKTPATLISNEPERASAFVQALGDGACAIKPLLAHGVSNEQGFRLPLTTILPAGHPLDSVALAPNIFQPYIEKAFELRCVVMGDKIFSAKMDTQADEATRNDWRAGNPKHEIFSLPEHVQAAIHRLMASFEINFASMDIIVTPSGEFVFLDLNPNGQWLWLETELGLPLVASMADLLTTYQSRPAQHTEEMRHGQTEVVYAS